MIVLEIHLDEGLPVVVALVQFDMIELVAFKTEFARDLHAREVCVGRARPLEQQALPVLQFLLGKIEAGIGRKMRRADKLAARVVGPAMDRTDDVLRIAGALQHDRLPMAADIGHLVAAVGLAYHQSRVVVPLL